MKISRMYREARVTWNPFVGCYFNCKYCYPSFRRQAKRLKKRCLTCYNYEPHFHPERLRRDLPRTREGEFIFTCDLGDIAFARTEWIYAIIRRIEELPDRDFLIQSKDPRIFHSIKFPKNVILGTTIETNYGHLIQEISKAPMPWYRYLEMKKLQHERKMVTIEPILEFDLDILVGWIIDIDPWRVYIGYDSHPRVNRLREPALSETKKLIRRLAWELDGIKVRDEEIVSGARFGRVHLKLIRKSWWEK